MASTTSLPMASANIWTNFVFFIAALVLTVYLIYYSIAPWYAGAGAAANNNQRSGLWQTHRPKALRRFLLLTIASLIIASLLNILFYVQGVPSGGDSNNDAGKGPTFRIRNLQLGGWLALRSLSNIFQQLPFALLFLTLINILQSRWYTLHKYSTGHKVVSASSSTLDHDAAEYKFPNFLGWKGKEGCSFFVAFLLVFIPVLSNVLFSIGFSKYLASGALDDYSKVVKAVTFLDAWNCVMVIIAIADISVSSYFLFQQMRKSHYYDLVCLIFVISTLSIFDVPSALLTVCIDVCYHLSINYTLLNRRRVANYDCVVLPLVRQLL